MCGSFTFVIFVSVSCFVGFIYAQDGYGCQKNECAKYKCVDQDKCYGRLIKNGSLMQCGCCDMCVKYLEFGKECSKTSLSFVPRDECGEGLTCDNSKDPDKPFCNYANTKCIQAKVEMMKKEKDSNEGYIDMMNLNDRFEDYTMGAPQPECDTFGDYKPVQCKEGMKCYCVDINGTRIFGLAPYTKKSDMNCSCSRDYETFKRYLKNPDEPNQFMRCASNGDYFHTQCMDDKCYCVDSVGVLTKIPSNKNEIAKLMCSDEMIQDYTTPCIKEYMETSKKIEEFNGLVLGIEPPACDLDGSYSPVQCKGFECYCVNTQGQKATAKSIARNSEEARRMKCGCVREKNLLIGAEKNLISDILTQYKCDNNGNYLPVQCNKAVCFCVDEIDGFQIGPPNLVTNRQKLPCYRSQYEDILNIIFD